MKLGRISQRHSGVPVFLMASQLFVTQNPASCGRKQPKEKENSGYARRRRDAVGWGETGGSALRGLPLPLLLTLLLEDEQDAGPPRGHLHLGELL